MIDKIATNSRISYQPKPISRNDSGFADCMNSVSGQKDSYKVYMKKDDMLFSGGNGTGLSYYLKYAEESTKEDPQIVAKGVDEDGNDFEEIIHINRINPQNASIVEMRALEAHLGAPKRGGFSSLPIDTNMGLHEKRDFMQLFEKQIEELRLLSKVEAAEFYERSMQFYWDYISKIDHRR